MSLQQPLRIGTRGSRLALYQAELVQRKLKEIRPDETVVIVPIRTEGDTAAVRGKDPFATKRIFTKEIENTLLAEEVDIAVHSAKDVAVELPPETCLASVLPAEDSRDCFLSRSGQAFMDLPRRAVVGTSSLRRRAQVLRHRPDLVVEDIRGNVETRIRKMKEGGYDAVILAYAGLKRVELTDEVTEVLEAGFFYPAPGQGTILIQCRKDDVRTLEAVQALHDEDSASRLECERAFLRRLGGGCQLPCGVFTFLENGTLTARGALFSISEREWVEAEISGPASEAGKTGEVLAEKLLGRGGARIIESIRRYLKDREP